MPFDTYEVVTDKGTFELIADREPTPAEAQAAILGQLQAEHVAPAPAEKPPLEGTAEAPAIAIPSMGDVAATAASVGLPIAGAVGGGALAGPPGAIAGGIAGGAAGEAARAAIRGEPQQPRAIAAEGAVGGIGAIPFLGKPAGTLVRGAIKGALGGAALGAGSATTRSLIKDGELPQTADLMLSTGAGLVFGAAVGGAQAKFAPGQVTPLTPEGAAEPIPTRPSVDLIVADTPPPEVAPPLAKPPGAPPEPPGGGFRLEDVPPDFFQKEFTPEFFQKLNTRLQNAPDQLESISQNSQRQRLYLAIADEMDASGAAPEMVSFFRNTVRSDAQKLNFLSQLRKSMKAMEANDPSITPALNAFNQAIPPDYFWQRFLRLYRPIENIRRASLTAQFATTARNILSQTGRYSTEVLDQAVQSGLGGEGLGRSFELTASFARQLTPSGRRDLVQALDQFARTSPKNAQLVNELFATPAGEITLGSRYAKIINTFNVMQESFFRRALFDGSLRGELRARGADVGALLSEPAQLPADAVNKAVQTALEGTFAATPKQGTFGRAVLNMYRDMPLLTQIHPFPRFLANSYKFLYDFSPAGYTRLMLRDPTGKYNWASKATRNQILSRASLGTAFLGAGLAVRNSSAAGEKWYQIQAGDSTIDARPFAPLATYLFIADVMKTLSEVGVDVIRDGKGLTAALKARRGMTGLDVAQGMLSMSRLAGTGLVAIEFLKPQPLEQATNLLRDFAANYIGSFTVPFRTVKDFVAGVDPNEAILRDTRELLLGRAEENIPLLSQTLPPKQFVTRAEPPKAETPVLRQLTGLSLTTANQLEKELQALHLSPFEVMAKSGEPKIDRVLNQSIAEQMQVVFPRLVTASRYQRATDTEKIIILQQVFKETRSVARERLKVLRPDLAKQLAMKQVSADAQALLEERGVKLPAAP
jgi:hypothetical protein